MNLDASAALSICLHSDGEQVLYHDLVHEKQLRDSFPPGRKVAHTHQDCLIPSFPPHCIKVSTYLLFQCMSFRSFIFLKQGGPLLPKPPRSSHVPSVLGQVAPSI